MNAGSSWLKTALALLFFLGVLFLMPETAPVHPVLRSEPAPLWGVNDEELLAWDFGTFPLGDSAVLAASHRGTMTSAGRAGSLDGWHGIQGAPAQARNGRWSANE